MIPFDDVLELRALIREELDRRDEIVQLRATIRTCRMHKIDPKRSLARLHELEAS